MSGRPGGAPALTAADVDALRECLSRARVAVFPADTVYGLGCDPDSEPAVRRLYELKGRPATRPAAVLFFALHSALHALPELGPRERVALRALLPGPLTLLLENRAHRYPLADGLSGAGGSSGTAGLSGADRSATLGLRVPRLPEPLAALGALEEPLLQSSANLSGGPDCRRVNDVPESIRSGADLVLDGGELPGIASTVLDLRDYERSGVWQIVRAGPVGEAEIAQAIG